MKKVSYVDPLRTEEEHDRVSDVSQNELQSEVLNSESAANPSQNGIDSCDKGQNDEHVCPV